jgi:RimJ/RimL family protein N-acetyltransferase
MLAVFADPELYRFIGGAPPTFEELQARFAGWALGSGRPGEAWHNWVIRLQADGSAVGHLQATVVDGDEDAAGTADIAWLVGTPWQGRGYATESARALLAWLESSGIRTITAHVHPDHAASGRVAAGAGLEPTEEIEDGEAVWRRRR